MPQKTKPRALKLLEGTDRRDRENPNEPIYEPTTGLTSDGLRDGYAVQVWEELRDILESKFVLTRADRLALMTLCNYQSMVDEKWRTGQNPTAAEVTQLRMMWVEFGITPASRPKVSSVGEAKKQNRFAELG